MLLNDQVIYSVKLILLGLGNPGKKYKSTRHNLGHWFVDRFANFLHTSFLKSDCFCVASSRLIDKEVVLLKSLHFMNSNGTGLASFLKKTSTSKDQFMLVHDEVNMPVGRVKFSSGKSAGGHNGVRSVIDALGYSPTRMRLGIDSNRSPDLSLSKYVLSDLSKEEQKSFDSLFPNLLHAIKLFLSDGLSSASNYANRYPIPSPAPNI